ncbi:hypothetical protein QBC44DRAFT_370111 [Cladorrhinum sp. PSN332]|nr:hypothetical protein QBC44DRAFT_370111 [Cladorrhinum sp. PSN332]
MKAIPSINVTVSEKIGSRSDQGLVNSPSQLICQRTKEANASSLLFRTISALNPAACLGLARRTVTKPDGARFRYVNAAAKKAREARKRSEAIDLQIRQECKLRKNLSQLLLFTAGYRNHDEGKRLILDNMARRSNQRPDANRDRCCLAGQEPSEKKAAFVRNALLNVVRETVKNVFDHFYGMDETESGPVWSTITQDWEHPQWASMHQAGEKVRRMLHEDKNVNFQEAARAVEELWGTEVWRWECYQRAGRPKAFDDKFLDILRRAAAQDYTPSLADVRFATYCLQNFIGETYEVGLEKFVEAVDLNNLLRRLPSTGSKGKRNFGYFSDATCILCPIDMASYTRQCPDSKENNLACAIETIQGFFQSSFAPHASILLLFWNLETFKKKMKTWPLEKYFSDYKPTETLDPGESAVQFITDKLLSRNTPKDPDLLKQVYVHVGEPGDRGTFDFITACLKQSRLDKQLSDAGVMKRME